MQDTVPSLIEDLSSLSEAAWLGRIEESADDHGYFQHISARHSAAFIRGGKTLLVSFETIPGIYRFSQQAMPVGFEFSEADNWSVLAMIATHDTWFRDPSVYRYFDRLIDDGFFDDYDRVVFYGAGSCGYAASAFSVAAPGATVLALSPQATLDPRVTEWDHRFRKMRRVNFIDRYGYAPDMLDAAEQAFVFYDPRIDLDAMHTALFTRPNVHKLRLPFMGDRLDSQMDQMAMLEPIISAAGKGTLTPHLFHELHRSRRQERSYLRLLLVHFESLGQFKRAIAVCTFASTHLNAPRFRKRIPFLEQQFALSEEPDSPE